MNEIPQFTIYLSVDGHLVCSFCVKGSGQISASLLGANRTHGQERVREDLSVSFSEVCCLSLSAFG